MCTDLNGVLENSLYVLEKRVVLKLANRQVYSGRCC